MGPNKKDIIIDLNKKHHRTFARSTHNHLKLFLFIGQIFAIFPLSGLLHNNGRLVQFKWISWCTFYTFSYLGGLLFIITFQIYDITCVTELKFGYFVTLLFYSCSFLTTILFIGVAKKWRQLMRKWSEVDYRMRTYSLYKNLSCNLATITIVVLLAAIIEHGMYLSSAITNIKLEGKWDIISHFLENNFLFIFKLISFALWKGALLWVVNLMCTFTWNYMDLYIMLISTTLAYRFKQISGRVRVALASKYRQISFWHKLRNDYDAVSSLCNDVDKIISNIVVLSFANNLFVILVQLLYSLKPRSKNIVDRMYFMYSFTFLISRTAAVALFASKIHENSKEPTPLLLSAPSENYNVEMERLLYRIQTDPPALTGKKLFNITKSLLLSITGAIVTYELVLIQFNITM